MQHSREHERWMLLALEQAQAALQRARQDVPIGAIIVSASGAVIAAAHNERELLGDPTAHAEIVAMRAAASVLGDRRLEGCTLVVTLEPCAMCAGAALAAHIPAVVFGAWDPKAGAAGSVLDVLRERRLPGRAEVTGGVLESECAQVLETFFQQRRC